MKRKILIILIFFIIALSSLCLMGCNDESKLSCVSTKTACYLNCDACDGCYKFSKCNASFCSTQHGVYCNDPSRECAWYPFYCGFGSTPDSDCNCIIIGFQLNKCSTYKTGQEGDSIYDKRQTRNALENIDYEILGLEATADGGRWEKINYADLFTFKWYENILTTDPRDYETTITLKLNFKAISDLAYAKYSVKYKLVSPVTGTSHKSASNQIGNTSKTDFLKTETLSAGTTYSITVSITLSPLEVLSFKGIEDSLFNAVAFIS